MFAGDAFGVERVAIDFPCSERDAKKGVDRLTAALARGSGGTATRGAKEWSALGWYQVAAYAVARAHCCDNAPPVVTPPLLATCKLDAALGALTKSAIGGSDAQLSAALDAYRGAIHCAQMAGRGGYFRQKERPTTAQAAIFLRMLSRLRASRQGG
jgi:hypothetical protein